MSLLKKLLKPITKLLTPDVEKPKLSISTKSKTDLALPIIVGSNYVKIEPQPVFKRVSVDEERVGQIFPICIGFVSAANQDVLPYADDLPFDDSKFRRNVGGETQTYLWEGTSTGSPNSPGVVWADFDTWFNSASTIYGKGICHAKVMYRRDTEIFESEPKIWFKAKKGNLEFLDGQPGLSSAWCDNPFAVIEWYMRDTFMGPGISQSLIGDSFNELTLWNESNLVNNNGETRKRFTVNGLIDSDQDFDQILEDLEEHCLSKINWINGKLEIVAKGKVTTPFMDLNDSNIVLDEDIEVELVSAKTRYTRVTVSWINPAKNWEEDQAVYPEIGSSEYDTALAENNGVVNDFNIKLLLIDNYEEAFEQARIRWRESQNFTRCTLTAHAVTSQLIQYDVVSVTLPYRNWSQKLFLVERRERKQGSNGELYEFDLVAYNPTIYDWSGLGDYTPVATYNYVPVKPPAATTPAYNNVTRLLTWVKPVTDLAIKSYDIYVDDVFYLNTVTPKAIIDLDVGDYDVSIMARGFWETGEPLDYALTVADLALPILTLEAGNFAVKASAIVADSDSTTSFDFFIGQPGTPTENDTQNAPAYVNFVDLQPNTEYTIHCRTRNPYAVSAWLTDTITTTNDGAIFNSLTGLDFSDGRSVAALQIYRRSPTPINSGFTGGSFDFDTLSLTPPVNWSTSVPYGTDPVYVTQAIACSIRHKRIVGDINMGAASIVSA